MSIANLGQLINGSRNTTSPANYARSLSLCDVRDCQNLVESHYLVRFPPISRVHERASWWNALYGRLNFVLSEKSAPITAICRRHFSDTNHLVPDIVLPPAQGVLMPVPSGLLRPSGGATAGRVRTYSRAAAKRRAARAATDAERQSSANSVLTPQDSAGNKKATPEVGANKPGVASRFKPIAPAQQRVPASGMVSTAQGFLSSATAAVPAQTSGSGGVVRLQLPPATVPATSVQLLPVSSSSATAQPYQLVPAAPTAAPVASRYMLSNGNVSKVLLLPQQQQNTPQLAGTQPTMLLVNSSSAGRAVAPPPRLQPAAAALRVQRPLRPAPLPQLPQLQLQSRSLAIRLPAAPRGLRPQPPPNPKLPIPPLPHSSPSAPRRQPPKSAAADNSAATREQTASEVPQQDRIEATERRGEQVLGTDTNLVPKEEVVEVIDVLEDDDINAKPILVTGETAQIGVTAKDEALKDDDDKENEGASKMLDDVIHCNELANGNGPKSPEESKPAFPSALVENFVKCEVNIKEEYGVWDVNDIKTEKGAVEETAPELSDDRDAELEPPARTIRLRPLSVLTAKAGLQEDAGVSAVSDDADSERIPPSVSMAQSSEDSEPSASSHQISLMAARLLPTAASASDCAVAESPPHVSVRLLPAADAAASAVEEPPANVSIRLTPRTPPCVAAEPGEAAACLPVRVPTPPGINLGEYVAPPNEVEMVMRSMRVRGVQLSAENSSAEKVTPDRQSQPSSPEQGAQPAEGRNGDISAPAGQKRPACPPPAGASTAHKRRRPDLAWPSNQRRSKTIWREVDDWKAEPQQEERLSKILLLSRRRKELAEARAALVRDRRRRSALLAPAELADGGRALTQLLARLLRGPLLGALQLASGRLHAHSTLDTVTGLLRYFLAAQAIHPSGEAPPAGARGPSETTGETCCTVTDSGSAVALQETPLGGRLSSRADGRADSGTAETCDGDRSSALIAADASAAAGGRDDSVHGDSGAEEVDQSCSIITLDDGELAVSTSESNARSDAASGEKSTQSAASTADSVRQDWRTPDGSRPRCEDTQRSSASVQRAQSSEPVDVPEFSLPEGLSITLVSSGGAPAGQPTAAAGGGAPSGAAAARAQSESLTVTPLVAAADSAGQLQLAERRRCVRFVCCRLCGAAGFSSWVRLDAHMWRHHGVKDVLVAGSSQFQPHLYVVCAYCAQQSSSEAAHRRHVRTCHPGRERHLRSAAALYCLHCEAVIGDTCDLSTLRRRRRPASRCDPSSPWCPSLPAGGEKHLKCLPCGVMLRNLDQVSLHAERHLLGAPVAWARCMLCTFEHSRAAVQAHVLRAHQRRCSLLGCSACPLFGTDQWTAVVQHMTREHAGGAPARAPLSVCRQCRLTLVDWPGFMLRHSALHTTGKLRPVAAARSDGADGAEPGAADSDASEHAENMQDAAPELPEEEEALLDSDSDADLSGGEATTFLEGSTQNSRGRAGPHTQLEVNGRRKQSEYPSEIDGGGEEGSSSDESDAGGTQN